MRLETQRVTITTTTGRTPVVLVCDGYILDQEISDESLSTCIDNEIKLEKNCIREAERNVSISERNIILLETLRGRLGI